MKPEWQQLGRKYWLTQPSWRVYDHVVMTNPNRAKWDSLLKNPVIAKLAKSDNSTARSRYGKMPPAQNSSSSSKALTVMKSEITSLVLRRVFRELPPSTSPLDTAAYNEFFAQYGAMFNLPRPRPFFRGQNGVERFVYYRGRTVVTTVTIPAGQIALIVAYPHYVSNPLRAFVTVAGAGTALTAQDWGVAGASLDYTQPSTTDAEWAITSPHSLWMDPSSISGGYQVVPSTAPHQLLMQQLAGNSTVEMVVPYQATAIVHTVSEASNRRSVGRNNESHLFDVNVQSPNMKGLKPEFLGQNRIIHMPPASMSPYDLAKNYGKSTVCCGATSSATHTFHICHAPDHHWVNVGKLALASAVDGTRSSNAWNFRARDAMPAVVDKGLFVIEGDPNYSISCRMSMACVFAAIPTTDDSQSTVPALQSTMRTQMPTLSIHEPAKGAGDRVAADVIHTAGQSVPAHRDKLEAAGVPPSVAQSTPEHTEKQPETFLDRFMGTTGKIVDFLTGNAQKILTVADHAANTLGRARAGNMGMTAPPDGFDERGVLRPNQLRLREEDARQLRIAERQHGFLERETIDRD
jgi:hypothetical protein